jgi:hypothetical protein
MKNFYYNFNSLSVGILVLLAFSLHSCGQRSIPREIVGHWTTQNHLITVRTKPENNWEFTSDTANITFKINNDHTVDGSIGSAKFENGKIKLNWLLPVKMSEIAFTIQCGKVGKIFENDPLDLKEVELWLGPIIKGTIDGELRYTQGLAYFPMAGAIFTKAED